MLSSIPVTHFDTVMVMKNINKILILFVALLVTQDAWSQRRTRSGGGSTYGGGSSYDSGSASTPIETTYSSESSSGGSAWAIGLASSETLLMTNDTVISGVYNINDNMAVQGFFYYAKDATNDKNSLGALFKYTVAGNEMTGFHVGGGLAFGKTSSSYSFTNLQGVGGFHFRIHKRVSIHVDGGLTISNYDNAQGKQSGTFITGASDHFGVSLLYAL